MAQAYLRRSRISLIFDDGVDEKGKPVTKTKTFTNVALTATPDSIQQFAQAYASLQQKPLVTVERIDNNDILS
ncbi:hypothetical protein BpJC7_00410 [Weizmannia acidilactici]|uniref:DUF1659 domain-containing protein n=1 Tax=Weizmannia acidilactici TaxID=2607726 RepID=A0A5J4JEJ0_9BACI|nr:DUF1659 domain-containing protein [Weizmannia acidilactici]GER67461.1 hypothetical protein BpJC4_19320 [Weizmannia acidilactici]GER68738.1 hypothetical protein BpJC7_00410 [Weizmannia acidilactici]GER74216.1 hypothetical protein BpPP18_22830 [Weizmannia acidilactici]